MRILFIFPRPKPYNSQSVRQFPSGGTEKAVIFLGEAFQKLGHEVQWLTTTDQIREYSGNPDVVITQVAELLENFPQAKNVWWTHHFSDQPVIQQNAAFARCFADKIVTLSQCHHDDFISNLRLDSVTIGHGVWLEEVAQGQKDPYRLIYASTPFRGLERIPALFKAIKEREPRATIGIASSMRTYGDETGDQQYQKLFDDLGRIPGVELLGSLNQKELYKEYARASIFFYPCIWPETYCLAMDEAIAHGCRPIHTGFGALEERAESLEGFMFANFFKYRPWVRKPKDWLEIAKQWEREVLCK